MKLKYLFAILALIATTQAFAQAGRQVSGVPLERGHQRQSHGLNEHSSVRSVYLGRDYLTDLVKTLADAG